MHTKQHTIARLVRQKEEPTHAHIHRRARIAKNGANEEKNWAGYHWRRRHANLTTTSATTNSSLEVGSSPRHHSHCTRKHKNSQIFSRTHVYISLIKFLVETHPPTRNVSRQRSTRPSRRRPLPRARRNWARLVGLGIVLLCLVVAGP